MQTKDLVELVKQGARPIVKITDNKQVLEGPDSNMLGRIVGIGEEDPWGEGTSAIPFIVDFTEFTEYNKTYAVANWYDSDGSPSLTWMETNGYERQAKKYPIYEMYMDKNQPQNLLYLEVTEENKWFKMYLRSKSYLTYTQWLEEQLDKWV